MELAGLAHLDPGTLLGGLCELATMITNREQASRLKARGDARLEEHRRRKTHRRRSASPTMDGEISDAETKHMQA